MDGSDEAPRVTRSGTTARSWAGLLLCCLPMAVAACASFMPWAVLSEGPIHVGSAPTLSGFQRGWGWVSFAAALVAIASYLAGMLTNQKWFIVCAIVANAVVIGIAIYNLVDATGEYYGSAPWGLFFGLAGGILGLILMLFALIMVTSR